MAQIREALEGIDTASKRRLIVAVRSTVLPGTCEGVLGPILGRSGAILVSNPEFLREGNAVRDFLEPPLVVAGSADTPAAWRVARLYSASSARPCLVSLRTAEMVKCASNAFHALKIAFANEIGALCAASGTSGTEVMEILCRDRKLSISASYLRPGFAFGGSCLPKELRGLEHQARDAGLELPLLRSILPSNREHLDRAINAALALPEGRIGVIGVSFKPDTDDIRESPAVRLLEALIENHRQVRAFDPQIRLDRLRKSSSRLLLSRIPNIEEVLVPELPELLGWAHRLVLTRRPRSEHAKLIRESGLPVLDLAHALLVVETGPGEAGDTRGVEEVGARRAR
jgi:GDP-mannose 6-dehydrogenase